MAVNKGLEFREKRKADKRNIEDITYTLFEFVTKNKNYLEITFSIMSTINQNENNMREKVTEIPNIDTVEDDEKLDEYIRLIEKFYSLNVPYRRGDLLELLSSHISPLNKSEEYDIIHESLVYENGKKISNKDLDIITQYKDSKNIECIECKSNVKNFIGIDEECTSKLNFMQLVSEKANIYGIKSRLLFITYVDDIQYSLDILKENGYNTFEIIKGSEIIKRLSLK